MKETIEIKYLNPPREGKTNWNVKTPDNRIFGLKAELAQTLRQGETYEVETKSREFNGKTYYSIEEVLAAANGNGNGHAATPAPSHNGNARSPETQARIERQHSQHMALLYCGREAEAPDLDTLRGIIDWFQNDIVQAPVATAKSVTYSESEAAETKSELVF